MRVIGFDGKTRRDCQQMLQRETMCWTHSLEQKALSEFLLTASNG